MLRRRCSICDFGDRRMQGNQLFLEVDTSNRMESDRVLFVWKKSDSDVERDTVFRYNEAM